MHSLDRGISGCKLLIFERQNIIRKVSADITYNKRLSSQMTKQKYFSNINISGIDIPRVLESSYENSHFQFDMEFILGENPIDFFLISDTSDIKRFIKSLFSFFDYCINSGKKDNIDVLKIKCLEKIDTLSSNSEHKDFLQFLKQKIHAISDRTYDKTPCHGDLTLSNMICQKKQIYLIDFLDSYIDSVFIDLVKLKQDLLYEWTLHNFYEINNIEYFRIKQIFSHIWEKLTKRYDIYVNSMLFDIIESLNFLRIEPYVKLIETRSYLNKIIKSLTLYEEFTNTNGRKIDKVSEYETKMDADTPL